MHTKRAKVYTAATDTRTDRRDTANSRISQSSVKPKTVDECPVII